MLGLSLAKISDELFDKLKSSFEHDRQIQIQSALKRWD
jgi:hypothetical protein